MIVCNCSISSNVNGRVLPLRISSLVVDKVALRAVSDVILLDTPSFRMRSFTNSKAEGIVTSSAGAPLMPPTLTPESRL